MASLMYGMDWSFLLACLILLAWSVVLFLYLTALIYGKIHLHKAVNKDIEKTCLPGVSIAKPLCGAADANTVENLKSYFELDYPEFEILFCIQSKSDEDMIQVVNDLIDKYPQVDARVFVGAQEVGINPKINNMMNAYDNCKYGLFMISDANIRVRENTLRDMISFMTEKVGLVHQLPLFCDGQLNFARQVEKVWFGGAHARVYLAANAFGINCMTSMSCMFRKKITDDMGGLGKFGCYIGEDFFLSQTIINKGWHLALCSLPAEQNSGISTIKSFQTRMKRWMYIRFTEMPHLLIFEPLQEHIYLGPLASLSLYYLFHTPIYITLPAHFVFWLLADYILMQVLENKRCPFSFLVFCRAWLFRELSPLYLFPTVLKTRTISWGGHNYLIRYGGKAKRVDGLSESYL